MATGTAATAVGAVLILYYLVNRRRNLKEEEQIIDGRSSDLNISTRSVRRRLSRRPAQAPVTWFETIGTLSETLRFTYSETLGKWPIGDLAFGINYLMRRQGYLQVASIYAGNDSVQLKGPEVVNELKYFLKLMTMCMLFSKKPFPVFLESAGYSEADVLLQKPKAGLLKPAFTILCDHGTKCFLLLIRGTHSMKDTLTAATGAVVPFHHSVLHDGGISNLVLGYAHCGMVAAARWIAKLSTPCLTRALNDHPDYKIKVHSEKCPKIYLTREKYRVKYLGITLNRGAYAFLHNQADVVRIDVVGHSLGGGTAALLTYVFREQKEFSSSTCVTFAPAACMTWELAESGKHFITTIINGSDLVPTFSTASIDDLRSEVTASSWINDLRDQVEQTRVLNVMYRSATAIGSRLPSIASAKARVAGAGARVSSSTQGVMKQAQNVAQAVVRTRPNLSSWTCMGARRRNIGQSLTSKDDIDAEESLVSSRTTSETLVSLDMSRNSEISNEISYMEEDEEHLMESDKEIATSTMEAESEGELWYQLERELKKREDEVGVETEEEEIAVAQEITEERKVLADAVDKNQAISTSDITENYRFYPPGLIMHIVSLPSSKNSSLDEDHVGVEHVGIYQTPRHLYNKIRLSKTMINDHYMPMYKKMMEQLIDELEKDESYVYVT